MRKLAMGLGLSTVVLFLGVVRADNAMTPKPNNPSDPRSQAIAVDALPPGEYVGKVVNVNPTDNALVLQIVTQRQVLKNPDGPTRTFDQIVQDVGKDEQSIGQLERNAATSRTIAEYKRKQDEVNKAVSEFQKNLQKKQLDPLQQQLLNPQPVEYVTLIERKDLKLPATKEMKVRLREPPAIDEEGRIRSYSPEELRALKGKEPYLPGYDGKLSNLHGGEYVRVTVAPRALPPSTEKPALEPTKTAVESPTEVVAIVVIPKEIAERSEPVRR